MTPLKKSYFAEITQADVPLWGQNQCKKGPAPSKTPVFWVFSPTFECILPFL